MTPDVWHILDHAAFAARMREAAQTVGGIKALASKAGVSEASMHRALSGTRDVRLGTVVAIAQAAGVGIGWLLGQDSSPGEQIDRESPIYK